jgi:hypothetical protein
MNGYLGSALIGLLVTIIGLLIAWLTPADRSKERPR